VAIYTIIVAGTNLSYGYGGELSFAQPAIFALGAYVAGYMATHGANDLLVTIIVASIAGAVAGLLIGIPGLRLNSWSLAMVSFFLVLLIPNIVSVLSTYTGGYSDLAGIPQPELFGDVLSTNQFFIAIIVVTTLSLAFVRNLVLSRHGNAIRTLRESAILTASLGSSAFWMKLEVYVIGSVPAAIAGALFAFYDQLLDPTTFGFNVAVGIVAASIIGGSRSIYGAIIGATILQIGPFESTSFAQYSLIAYGALLLVGGLLLRNGITSLLHRLESLVMKKLAGRYSVPELKTKSPSSPTPSMTRSGPLSFAGNYPGTVEKAASDRGLNVSHVTRRFGGLVALNDVSATLEPGRVTAIIGPNGSGKTTLLNLISGFYAPNNGSISLSGEPLNGRQAHRVARLGVSRTFQTPIIPEELTVAEVVAGSLYRRDYVGIVQSVLRLPAYARARERDRQRAKAALDFVGIASVKDEAASSLSLGTRRLVEVARALACEPRILLLDEPASGLSESDVLHLGGVLKATAEAGVIVILVEHNFQFVLETADFIVVLNSGAVLATGAPSDIRDNPDVLESYLGAPIKEDVAHFTDDGSRNE
jgi:branched-chain amino acid transport system permease protein